MKRWWFRRAPAPPMAEPPAHFPPEFARTFVELCQHLGERATADRAIELEAATLLLEHLRVSTPEWPTERYRVLAEILRGLRA